MNLKQKTQIVFNSETFSEANEQGKNEEIILDQNFEPGQERQSNLSGNIHSVGILQNSLAELNQNFSTKKRALLIDGDSENPRAALVGHGKLLDYEYYTNLVYSKGSIHLGVVTKILPGLQAVFVKYKNGRNGFLPFSEIDPIYLKSFDEIDGLNRKDKEILYENEISEKSQFKKKIQKNLNEEGPGIYDLFDNFDLDSKKENIKKDQSEIKGKIEEDSEEYGIVYSDENNDEILGFICIGQVLILQIVKEERGSKGSSLTTFISLNGRYCIYMPNKKNKNAISKNITNLIDKKRLDLILRNLKIKEGGSLFILDAALRANTKEIHQDYEILTKLWDDIKIEAYKIFKVPSVVYYEKNLIKNIFFNMNMLNVKSIIIEGQSAYENAIDFARNHIPSFLSMIKIHDIDCPIFKYYGVDSAVNKLSSNVISLKSGGYIVWNKTEALVSIDVNSGKSKDEFCIEETALKTNLEAIAEIMIQVKLRKISGLIVIDLIGMRDPYNTKLIETTARRLTGNDKAKIQIYLVEDLSLLVFSRQRLGQSLMEAYGSKCQNCHGFGYISSDEVILKKLFDDLKNEIFEDGVSDFNIFVNKKFLDYILNEGRKRVFEFENKFNCSLKIKFNPSLEDHINFIIEKVNQNDDEFEDENLNEIKYKKQGSLAKKKSKISEIHSEFVSFAETFEEDDLVNVDKRNNYSKSSTKSVIIENLDELKNETSFVNNNRNNKNEKKKMNSIEKNSCDYFSNSQTKQDNFEKIHFLYKIWNEWMSE